MTKIAPRVYERELRGKSFAWGRRLGVRIAARSFAVAFYGLTIASGLVAGGHLEYEGSPWTQLPGKAAGLIGLAADDISIEGLVHQAPETVLGSIGVSLGDSLLGFDATIARQRLESLDWVVSASVQRRFPNQLAIAISERKPFAIWQQGTEYAVIDRTGAAMSGVAAAKLISLPLVTGAGAGAAVEELINQLEVNPGLKSQVRAAARVGERRWTLYLDNGVTILLPERDWSQALAAVQRLDATQQLLSKGVAMVDMRISGRIGVAIATVKQDPEKQAASRKN